MEERAGGESVGVSLGGETQCHRTVRLDEAFVVLQVPDGNRSAAIQLEQDVVTDIVDNTQRYARIDGKAALRRDRQVGYGRVFRN